MRYCKGLLAWRIRVILLCIIYSQIIIVSQTVQADVVFTDAQKKIIQSLTLSAKQVLVQQKKAEPSNQYSQNRLAKKLGESLFFDTRLSANGNISCATCHTASAALADNKTVAQGLGKGTRNTPTLINVFMQQWFFWDGRADSLWLQAIGPIESQLEMGGNWATIYALFLSDKKLLSAYNQVFTATPLHLKQDFSAIDKNRFKTNIGKALSAFQLDFVQFNSRFDRFAANIYSDKSPLLSSSEMHGLKIFLGKGSCINCHFGPNFSDGQFHNTRLKSQLSHVKDSGRYSAIAPLLNNPLNILGNYSDIPKTDNISRAKTQYLISPNRAAHTMHSNFWAAYKTPTLRNVTQTFPYMHDGSLHSLQAVIAHYSTFKNAAPHLHKNKTSLLMPLNLTAKEQSQLLAFLHTLTGEVSIPIYE